jgi:hypothetical protein
MNPFEFVIIILVLTFLFKLVNTFIQAKGTRRADDVAAVEAEELRRRLASVEERVQVLERIVTDEAYDLKRQFKDLAS